MGIVIGTVIGVALLALGAYFLGRRRRGHDPAPISPDGSHSHKNAYNVNPMQLQVYQLGAAEETHMMNSQASRSGAKTVWELSG